jgi:Ras-related protein Rab-4B
MTNVPANVNAPSLLPAPPSPLSLSPQPPPLPTTFPASVKKGPPKHTIGVEFGSRVVSLGGKTIKLQIWDTAGQERFRSVTRSYYRGAAGALIFYDITNRDTFEHLANWLSDARTLARPDISIVATGNKSDLKEERQVTFLEASRFCQENDAMFMETSAMTGECVEEAFMKCARSVLSKIESGESSRRDMCVCALDGRARGAEEGGRSTLLLNTISS